MHRRILAAAIVVGLPILLAGPASAHVTVDPSLAPKGSDAVLTFNAPNEMDNANTTMLEIVLPTDHPIATVNVQPKPGWTFKVDTVTVAKPIQTDNGPVNQAVNDVIWSGGQISPGQFDRFTISVGLPDNADSLEFKALQTYSNGQIVRWIEDTPKGGPAPDHPAPVLTLVAATRANTAVVRSNVAKTSDVDSAKTLAIIGVVLGALGVVVAIGALVVRRPSADH